MSCALYLIFEIVYKNMSIEQKLDMKIPQMFADM